MIRKQVIAYAPGVERSGSDIRSATTIRDQLMLHCEITTCNASHLRIDPQGFALENFDPTGGLRNKYRRLRGPSPRVDATRVVPSGERFDGVSGLKQVLPDNHREQLARNLSKKLLTCATGRVTEDRGRSGCRCQHRRPRPTRRRPTRPPCVDRPERAVPPQLIAYLPASRFSYQTTFLENCPATSTSRSPSVSMSAKRMSYAA